MPPFLHHKNWSGMSILKAQSVGGKAIEARTLYKNLVVCVLRGETTAKRAEFQVESVVRKASSYHCHKNSTSPFCFSTAENNGN